MDEYGNIEAVAHAVLGTPEGRLFVRWLRDLHVNYKFQPIVQSGLPAMGAMLAYQAGKADLVIELERLASPGQSRESVVGSSYLGGENAGTGKSATAATGAKPVKPTEYGFGEDEFS